MYADLYIHYISKGPLSPYSDPYGPIACNNPSRHNFDIYICGHPQRVRLPELDSLTTCRQVYHEARNVFFSANTFEMDRPSSVHLFLRHLHLGTHRALSVRSLHLNIAIPDRNEERKWDNILHTLVEELYNVIHVYVDVEEEIWNNCYSPTRRHSPALGKRPFLTGLLELKRLPLKTFELAMVATRRRHRHSEDKYNWTVDQKIAWARSMKMAILGTD